MKIDNNRQRETERETERDRERGRERERERLYRSSQVPSLGRLLGLAGPPLPYKGRK